jgi:hypothetical protein
LDDGPHVKILQLTAEVGKRRRRLTANPATIRISLCPGSPI